MERMEADDVRRERVDNPVETPRKRFVDDRSGNVSSRIRSTNDKSQPRFERMGSGATHETPEKS